MKPSIAIIDRNSLSLDALAEILQELFPYADVLPFQSMGDFFGDCDRNFVRFFVSEDVMLSNADDFDMLKQDTIVLCQGPGKAFSDTGFKVLDIFQPEKDVVSDIIRLHDEETESRGDSHPSAGLVDLLSVREREVLALMVKGYFNKEIADQLNISTSTAVFHRNNICSKLGTRSLGRLTIIAVLSGLVSPDEL